MPTADLSMPLREALQTVAQYNLHGLPVKTDTGNLDYIPLRYLVDAALATTEAELEKVACYISAQDYGVGCNNILSAARRAAAQELEREAAAAERRTTSTAVPMVGRREEQSPL